MAAKRYYWLKLGNTYFSQLEQKKMRKQREHQEIKGRAKTLRVYGTNKISPLHSYKVRGLHLLSNPWGGLERG